MRSIDDPRAAAKLFCDEHGITDGKTIAHLEDTFRDLIYPRQSPASSMGDTAPPSSRPASVPGPSPYRSSRQPISPLEDGRAPAGVPSRRAVEAHNTGVERENAAVDRLTAAWTAVSHGQEQGNGHDLHSRATGAAGGRGVPAEAAAAGAAATAASAAEEGVPKTPPAGIDVMEVARAMRDAAMASMGSADPDAVVVDLVVNGVPAPLVFRLPRRKLSARRNRDGHGHPDCDRENTTTLGKEGGRAGGGGIGENGARRGGKSTKGNEEDHGGQGGDGGESNAGVDSDADKEGARMRASRTEGGDGGSKHDDVGGRASSRSDGTCHGSGDDNDRRSDAPEVDQGRCDRTGKGAGESTSSRRSGHGAGDEGGGEIAERTPRTEPGVEGEGEDVEEDGERAIAAAAVAWCREFGSARIEDISFVKAEIRKAVAAREKAAAEIVDPGAAAAADAGGTGKDAVAASTLSEGNDAPSSKGRTGDGHPKEIAASKPSAAGGGRRDATPQAEAAVEWETRGEGDTEGYAENDEDGHKDALWRYDGQHHEGFNSRSSSNSGSHSSSSGSSSSSSSSSGGGGGGGGGGGSGRRRKEDRKGRAAGGHKERMTIFSVLAPDVEKGTSIFWVQVELGLPVVYVLAGYSALEISEQFCRSHKLGPSQVPLVAWKLLEAYPVQMEAARRDGTPLPAKVTLSYATRQPEVQAAALVIAAGLLLLLLRRRVQGRGCRWWYRARSAPGGSARGYLRRRHLDTDATTRFSAFRSRLFPRWACTKQQAGELREATEETTADSPTDPGGDSGACLAPGSRGVGELFLPSSLMRRFFGHAVGIATAEQAAKGQAGKGGEEPPAGSRRTNRKQADKENTGGPLGKRTTANTESTAAHIAAAELSDDTKITGKSRTTSSSVSNIGSSRKGVDGGENTAMNSGPLALSQLRSWVGALSFECGRLVGAAVRKAVVLPLMRVFGAGAGRNTDNETTSAEAVAASSWPRKRKQPASIARTRSRKGHRGIHGGLWVNSNRSEPAKRLQKGTSKGPCGCSAPKAAENEETGDRHEPESSGRGEGRAPFSAGRNDQRGSNGNATEGRGGEEGASATVAAAGDGKSGGGGGGEVPQKTWASVLDGLSRDPLNRFSEVALLSNVGHILAKTDAFAIEAHESCDWTRLFKSKKAGIMVGSQKFLVLSRDEGSIIVSNKALGTKMIGCKTRSGTVVLGAYTDHSKAEAREGVAWLAEALASSRVR